MQAPISAREQWREFWLMTRSGALLPLDRGTLSMLEARQHLQDAEREKAEPIGRPPSAEFEDLVFTNELVGPVVHAAPVLACLRVPAAAGGGAAR